jgi:hypothetical protein
MRVWHLPQRGCSMGRSVGLDFAAGSSLRFTIHLSPMTIWRSSLRSAPGGSFLASWRYFAALLQKVLFQLAAPITAAARSLMGSRSPSDARFRMRNAISDFSILALRSFGNDDHASSSALRRSFSVSGSYALIFLALKPNSTSKPLGLSVKSPT